MYDDDNSGKGWITLDWTDTNTPKPKKRKKVKVPTDDEQAELLKTAIEKELKEKGESGLRLQCAMQEYRHLHDRRDRWELHALNPYAGALWAKALEQAIAVAGIKGQPWFVTIIDDGWSFDTPTPLNHRLRSFRTFSKGCGAGQGCGYAEFPFCFRRTLRFGVLLEGIAPPSRFTGMGWCGPTRR